MMFPIDHFNEVLLGIKDQNIKLDDDNLFSVEKIGDAKAVVYHGTLTYDLDRCPNCGFSGTVIKNGTKSCRLLLPNGAGSLRVAYLELKKQRFYCKNCHSTTTAKTDIVDEHCSISRMVYWGIACEAKNNCTAKDIATRFCISGTSVQRIMVLNNKALVHETQVHLPQHLMFDEIKGVGGYNFIWADADSHVLEALLPTRRIQFLESYFRNFPIEKRQKVKTIVVDLNAAYISFIPKVFPNAQVIVDRFHIVNMVNRALNTTRKQLMKKYKHSSREYKVLKSYWRLFLKDSGKLEATKPMYQIHLGYYETQVNLIHNALELDPAFKETYWTYQQVLHAVHTRDSNLLKQTLNDYRPLHNEMDTTISTLKKNWSALLNSCRYEYSNGPLEGLNGKIKKIKKTSYGYRNFDNFKLRIYLECKAA